ncbi:uncharacterized protein LOC122395886 [Colletes gigas]|uniref:uncharacterized protein LOC122395886 n=1 Tax=Colletes gigas TaxID=935657 RepID=UPI001C9A858D|nr:uncharacterized protein LOC122395886 [Colletes gigas]
MHDSMDLDNTSDERLDNDDHQKNRDRELRGKRKNSCNRYELIKNTQLLKVRIAKWLIEDLENNGPAGLPHMEALSSIIGKPIRVWKADGEFYQTINENKNEISIDVEYHHLGENCIGHWTLKGNREPVNVETNLNGCLFRAIAAQTKIGATNLRDATSKYLKRNIDTFTDRIDEFLSANDKNGISPMIGGARYNGRSPKAAGIVLDKSQNGYSQTGQKGHPRGHASDKNATGPTDSVENYSRLSSSMKSGFLSKNHQNIVADFALRHYLSKEAMKNLNRGATNEAVTINARDFQRDGLNLNSIKMKEWYAGEEYSGKLDIARVTLVLRHHKGKHNDPDEDVFVHTFYPRSS